MARFQPAVALVDFYNAVDLPRGRESSYTDYSDGFEHVIARLDALAQQLDPQPTHLECRLYGGWASDHGESEDYQYLSAVVRKWSQPKSRIRVKTAFARSLLAIPDVPLQMTMRRQHGLPRFQTDISPIACALGAPPPGTCSLPGIRRWQRGKCPDPSCPVVGTLVFSRNRQKMVDTTLCCDAVYLAAKEPDSWLIVASDDDDMVPCVLSTGLSSQRVVQLRPRRNGPHYYDSILEAHGVKLEDW